MTAIYQNVWAQGEYIYHTASASIDVYNSSASSLLYQIPITDPTAVWANDSYIYIGTENSGVYRAAISGTASPYVSEPDITSNETIYLHGGGNYLCVSTVSGVDRYVLSTSAHIYTQEENSRKCFQTTSGTLYYITSNRFYSVDEDDLGAPLRNWKYYQYITFSETDVDNAQVYINIPNTFPFYNCKANGEDLRFISESNEVLNYYIESWYPNARVVVKVPDSGTVGFYMLYGNPTAAAQSNPENAYLFYDAFNGSAVDTSKWTVNLKGDGSIVVSNGYARTRDADNDFTEMITKNKFPYGYTEVRFRNIGSNNNVGNSSFFIGQFGYTSSPTSFVNSGYMQIRVESFGTHTMISPWFSSVVGAKTVQRDWKTWRFIFIEGQQSSYYNGETITASGTGIDTENYLTIRHRNNTNSFYLDIDYVLQSSYPFIETTTSTEQNLWEFIKPKLHAVYEPVSNWTDADYIYEEFYANTLYLNDIHLTEETSVYNNDNTIFLATDRGAHIIEERQGDEENSRKKYFFIK